MTSVAFPAKKIEDFCRTGSGGTPSRSKPEYFDGGAIPWVKSGELKTRFVSSTEESITDAAVEQSAVKLVPKGALLIAMYGATVGEVSELAMDATTNQAICHIVPDPNLCDRGYLYQYLSAIKPELLDRRVGGGQPNISQAIIKSLSVPLPPLPEQRRIAAILDKADALRAKRREAIVKLDQLLQSVFLEMFGDPVTNPKGWPETDFLGDVADICSGITKGRRTTEETREIPYLAVANVQDRHLKLGSVKTICATDAEIGRYRLAVNDLLLTEGGDPDKLGRGALWDGSIAECIHQNHVFRVRVTSPAIDPVFLNWLVGSARGKRYFLSVSKQTTGIASINMTQLKKFPLLTPPIELQMQFAQAVSKIEVHQRELEKAEVTAHQLFQSLQQQAFAGQL
ncbi:restriction endonuclease subunit S [Pseudomonas sp. SL4(2022)]|uniref:restriction endonuclease subunit S n=1 Tax=Pseudomonas sp. SL4(2022) TaxID=2994661 RepID=UPI0022710566|nr:restriction endonuclease subunit S [Pseudomonas sp. SL4(2022)]WAC43952.1 restriction endonuclease subunit S [Pseudomonas sp. SL4(2022)]